MFLALLLSNVLRTPLYIQRFPSVNAVQLPILRSTVNSSVLYITLSTLIYSFAMFSGRGI